MLLSRPIEVFMALLDGRRFSRPVALVRNSTLVRPRNPAFVRLPAGASHLLLGALLFVFYQFERPPLFFNQPEWQRHAQGPAGDAFSTLEQRYVVAVGDSEKAIRAWIQTIARTLLLASMPRRSLPIQARLAIPIKIKLGSK